MDPELIAFLQKLKEAFDSGALTLPGTGSGGDPGTGDKIPLDKLGLAAVVVHVADAFDDDPDQGLRGVLRAFGLTCYHFGEKLLDPLGALLQALGDYLVTHGAATPVGHMADLPWEAGFTAAKDAAYAYEHEKDRTSPLTLGEFFRLWAATIHQHWRLGSAKYVSDFKPSGTRKPESVNVVLGNIQSLLFSVGRWFGGFYAPRIEPDFEPMPPGWKPPWSMPDVP